jgi:uncharacterized membrane protein YoaK (UPF0700 family)
VSSSIREDILATVWPAADAPDGRLPPLLLVLTIVTGLVDAVSYLKLGRVFVANMTGNAVFLGFAIAGAHGLSLPASLIAILSFLAGGFAGGRLGSSLGDDRRRLLHVAIAVQLGLMLVSVLVAAAAGADLDRGVRYSLIVLLAVAMGIQNAAARTLAVPDLTTTVLTQTLAGIAADSRLAGGSRSGLVRRLLAVAAMLLGALVGALLVLKVANWIPLAIASVLLLGVALVTRRAAAPLTA